MLLNVMGFKTTISSWGYDNGWGYENKYWSSYSGPFFGPKYDHLILLNREEETVVLHYVDSTSEEIWRGPLSSDAEFESLKVFLSNYEENYRAAHNLHPTHDYEQDLIEEQNRSRKM